MKSPITKLAAAAVMIIAVLTGLHQLGESIEGASVAWAGVLENIRNSKTLTFLVRTTEDGPPIMKIMAIDPHHLRLEFLSEQIPAPPVVGGQILIVDTNKAQALILNTVKKSCKIYPADNKMMDIYNTFRNFRDKVDSSVDEIGSRRVADKSAVGFRLRKLDEDHEIIVWADAKTKLPVLMEETYKDAKGQHGQHVITDIVFDAELDKSLFSLEPPPGYKLEQFEYDEVVTRMKSAANMDRILKACRKYVNEHNGQWPDNMQVLFKYGLDKQVLTSPIQPTREIGYVYIKPPVSPSESRIVLYEAYEVWNGGINVGFANYQVQFIKEESDFKNRLEEPVQRR